jgi:phosphatidylglycerophosphate synthase
MTAFPALTALGATVVCFFLGYGLFRRWALSPSGSPETRRRAPTALVSQGLMEYVYWLVGPFERALASSGATPRALTLIGLALSAVAGVFAGVESYAAAGFFYLAGGVLDILDGRVARRSGQSSPAGALLDSVCDRWAEFAVLGGIAFAERDEPAALIGVLLATAGSQMVSYTRARAEALGVSLAIGLMQRSERIVLVGLGLLVAGGVGDVSPNAASAVLTGVLLFVGALSSVTAIRRLMIGMAALGGPEPVASRAKPVASSRELDGSRP